VIVLLAALAAAPAVQVGLERIAAERGGPLRGKRVGLVAHAASVTADGAHAIDVLRASGVDLRRLFGPEHGLRSQAAAGEKVAGGTDPESGLPVVSLYGEKTKPAPEDLRDLDALVVDLQDAGVRFYTYVSTMILCLEAAAAVGIELVVLDRPNPLGGERIEGPLRDAAVTSSLVNLAPGPLVHGLTLGEMARLVNRGRAKPSRLTVVPMSGWSRGTVWADTRRPWVPPSPNLRTAEAALAYPGLCLLEATNVSEGRGTEAPFLRLGAPWLKPEATAAAVRAEGFRLEPASFTPLASPAAPSPKYAGQTCQGLRVAVTDARAVRPYTLGLGLLEALRRLHPEFRWARDGALLDRLLGTRRVREALERGDPAGMILAADRPAIQAFARDRKPALLY
jgi:uncharacterized protein YbbC (DUF1343 family)